MEEYIKKTRQERNKEFFEQKDFPRLLINNRLFIISIAKSFNTIQHYDDLIQAGNIGLWYAYEKYDPIRGNFLSFAKLYIRKEMLKYLEQNLKTIRLPANVQKEIKDETYYSTTNIISLDAPINDNGDDSHGLIGEAIEDEPIDTSPLRRAIMKLKDKERDILERHYGMGEYADEQTMAEIGRAYGCTRENIRIHLEKIKEKIKNVLK